MKTIKLSYSIINTWSRGDYEQAVSYYLGHDFPKTPQMELGSLKDKLWTDYALKNKSIHSDVGGGLLKNPVIQKKYEKVLPFSKDIQLLIRGVPDIYDDHRIIDFKCGQTKASAYLESYQLDYYKMFLPEAKEGIYLCFNPYTKMLSKGVKYLTQKNIDQALNHIFTFSGEIIQYLESQKLLIDYKGKIT